MTDYRSFSYIRVKLLILLNNDISKIKTVLLLENDYI